MYFRACSHHKSQFSFITAAVAHLPADSSAAEVDVFSLTLTLFAEAVLVAVSVLVTEAVLVVGLPAEEEDVAMEHCSDCTPSLFNQYFFTCSFSAM